MTPTSPWSHTSVSSWGIHTSLAANDMGILAAMFRKAVIAGEKLYIRSDRGFLTKKSDLVAADIREMAAKYGLREVIENRGSHIAGRQGHFSLGFVNESSTVHFGFANNLKESEFGQASVEAASPNEQLVIDFVTLAKTFLTQKEPVLKGQVYSMTSGSGGLTISQIGFAGIDFIPENYTPDVAEGFENIKSDILSDNPMGRLAILEGEPGTGKTYFVRSLVQAIPTVKFIILPATLVPSLQGPEVQRCLLNEIEDDEEDNRRFVFIIEDSDDVIATREVGNMGSLSTLLNITDGITGAIFDIRAVCTTNAKTHELDPAISRSGRLSEHVKIGALPYEQAARVFRRLVGTETEAVLKTDKDEYTLAEVYAESKQTGRKHGKKAEKKSMGFGK